MVERKLLIVIVSGSIYKVKKIHALKSG